MIYLSTVSINNSNHEFWEEEQLIRLFGLIRTRFWIQESLKGFFNTERQDKNQEGHFFRANIKKRELLSLGGSMHSQIYSCI